ncbi:TonB-dependent receptor [Mitsuaria sp. WAJ17]|uniref:TonB-dependent siderophore receptor n=1 Tax=Mitsuaria sp. WAJ17 TaxID=2761452 RepID=UPI00160337FD|nr:TonB-dependent receptor [Mitsuaria sp. WAJ17]MBB2484522.1 TonB-dependent receptor [Mitsuaria sp. WAJ17]
MARITRSLPHVLAAACALACAQGAMAQSTGNSLPGVAVSGRSADAPVNVGGFGDTPAAKLPFQASVLNAERLADAGLSSLAGLVKLDASVQDSYNAAGYVSYLKVRGFELDNRFNYRRDGLPINAETALALGNKSSIEVFKGTSGIQAGTSSPGGLVNLVVKRPTTTLLSATLSVSERGTTEAALDWSQRFGAGEAFGVRINAASAQLRPELRDADGSRHLLAVAADARLSRDTLLEAELEWNRQSQRSQPGMSLLGDKLPSARDFDPRINLNNQDWSLPVVFDNRHASLRLTQRLNANWQAQAHLGLQRLKTDDRLAYAFGKFDPETYDCNPCDRYAADGSFSIWDFRSENERRNTEALDLSLAGRLNTGMLQHRLNTGVLLNRFESRFQQQAYNLVGVGTIDGKSRVPADPSLTDENTQRDERSTEFYLRDAVQIDAQWQAFLGLRHTRIQRDSIRTNGSRATSYSQNLDTPWIGLSYALSPSLMAYGSWGQGMESDVTPNRKRFGTQAGRSLPAIKSRQMELGLKSGSSTVDWSIAWFDIKRPVWMDAGACDDAAPGSCTRVEDGSARHRGLEAQADLKWSGGGLLASWMELKARREGSAVAGTNGLLPTNVPKRNIKMQVRQTLVAGLQGQLGLVYEGPRAVLPDNSVMVAGWTRLDAGLRYEQAMGSRLYTWRAGVDNLTDKRAWRESPYQYGHAYLYPLAPRTWRASLEVTL